MTAVEPGQVWRRDKERVQVEGVWTLGGQLVARVYPLTGGRKAYAVPVKTLTDNYEREAGR